MWLPWGINVKHIYLAFFSIVSIALCAFTVIIYNQYKRVENLNGYTIYQYEIIRQTRLILLDVVDMESGVRGYTISGDETFLKSYTIANNRLRDEVLALRNATYFEKDFFTETNVWLDSIEDIQKLLYAQVANVRAKGRGVASISDLEKQRAQMDALRKLMDKNVDSRLTDLKAHVKDVESQKANFIYILVIGNILGIGILLVGTITIIKLEAENQAFEDESRRAELRFRTVMNGINDGLYELNFVSETFYASKEFKAMLGYTEDELEDTIEATMRLIHPDDLPGTLEVRRQYIMKQTPLYNNVFRMKHKDGTWRWVMSRGVGTWDRFGQIRTLIGTHTDITDQKEREEEYRQLHADMEAFTYITSHDMRSPLVNLKGFSHELALAVGEVSDLIESDKKKLSPKVQARLDTILKADIPESLGFIGNAVDRMDTLTTAILDLSRIGKYVYRDEVVSAQSIFDKCLGAQSYEIAAKGVEVTVAPLPDLVADPLALEQIFSNLLDNAVKYLQPGRPGRIDISCVETGRDYVFSIRDNGRGIEPEDRQKVFHIFRRARNTGDVRGLGLGMAFVKATLRKMSGAIWFESSVDVGTTFYFSLPRKLSQTTAQAANQTPAETAPRRALAG